MFDEEHVIYRYKYLPFSEGSLKTISEGTIKFTNPLEFNDPFDCLPHYDITSINQITRMRRDLFKAAGDRKGLSPGKRIQQKGEFVARLRHRIEDGSFARDLMKPVGVVSLSRNALNIPMWSHYADFHKGLVLEFRIPFMGVRDDLALSIDRLLPFSVKYASQRPHIKIGTELPHDLVDKLVLTKSRDWEYEEEERVIDRDRGAGIFPYRRDEILSSVIAGLRISEGNFKRLETLIQNLSDSSMPNLSIFRAHEKKGDYQLEVMGHPRLDPQYTDRSNRQLAK